MRLGKIFGFQLLGDGRKGQHIIILVLDLVRRKFLVPLADEIIPAAVDQHIRCKQWLVVIGGDAGGKAAIGIKLFKVFIITPLFIQRSNMRSRPICYCRM